MEILFLVLAIGVGLFFLLDLLNFLGTGSSFVGAAAKVFAWFREEESFIDIPSDLRDLVADGSVKVGSRLVVSDSSDSIQEGDFLLPSSVTTLSSGTHLEVVGISRDRLAVKRLGCERL